MALFSMRVQQIKRSNGQSPVAAAAYRAGERLHDERQGVTHDYSRKSGVAHKEIMLPENAPAWARKLSRESLWNMVDKMERRKDSQTAREIRIMIPRELDPASRVRVVREFVQANFTAKGMIADICWHNKVASDGLEQPHAHVMLTMRPLTAEGFGNKSRHDWVPCPTGRTHADGRPVMVESNPLSWNSAAYYENCRADWEARANAALDAAGSAERIDRRSYLERGLSRLPEPYLGLTIYLKELHGVFRERFGQFQVARHYRAVEQRAKATFKRMEQQPSRAGDLARTAQRYFDWFDRQMEALAPARDAPPRDAPGNLAPDMER